MESEVTLPWVRPLSWARLRLIFLNLLIRGRGQAPSCSTLATQFLTYITTKLNQQSNFRFSLLHVFLYKKKLRNKTQLKKEHTILGYWPGILQKSNAQSILGQCGAHIEWKLRVPAESVLTKDPASGIPLPQPAHIFAAHFLVVMLGDYVRPPHMTRCQKYTHRISNTDYKTEAL